jgi:MSHA biogenesis protein MshJ
LISRFDALSMRERVLVVFAAVAVIYFVSELALLGPQRAEMRALQKKIAQQDIELATIAKATSAVTSAATPAADAVSQRAELDALRRQVEGSRTLLGEAATEARTGELVRAMSVVPPGLTLVSIKTLSVQPILRAARQVPGGAAPNTTASAPALYRHGVEAVVRGSFASLIPYMQKLEQGPIRVFWGDVQVEMETYPVAKLRLVVYALSTRPDSPLN